MQTNKNILAGSLLAITATLAACGGGSSGTTTTTPPPSTTPVVTAPGAAKVAGPLDAVQEPVSDQVISPLATSLAGTPLQGVVQCVDQIVVTDVIDVVDILAIAIQSGAGTANPGALLTGTAASVQAQVENIVIDLNGLLAALRGNSAACTTNTAPTGGNILVGTPLAPVGAALAPVLAQVYTALHGTSGPRPTLSLGTITSLLAQLEFALDSAIAQVPADVATAPVIGATLTTVQAAVHDLNDTLIAASTRNVVTTQTAMANTLNNLLSGVMLGIVPVTAIENQAGQAGMLSGPIQAGIDDVSSQISTGLGTLLQPVFEQNLADALAPVTGAIDSTILGAILGPLNEALSGIGVSLSSPLGPVVTALDGFFSGSEVSPLDLIQEVINGEIGCPLAGTPLAILCPST